MEIINKEFHIADIHNKRRFIVENNDEHVFFILILLTRNYNTCGGHEPSQFFLMEANNIRIILAENKNDKA